VGKSDTFEQAIPGFAVATFDASEQDHAEFVRAADRGRVKAVLRRAVDDVLTRAPLDNGDVDLRQRQMSGSSVLAGPRVGL
jgi:hypothetical protein